MSGYLSSFSFNKITDTIANAAHKTQDTLSNAIANVSDPQTKLSLKARTRYLQETLGTIDDKSKLPPQYQSLEKKSDALEKCYKRMLLVTRTFEVEGYDYPPNLTESISDWWSLNKDGWFGSSKKAEKSKNESSDGTDAFLPRSFSHAISKAANDCGTVFTGLQDSNDDQEEDEDVSSVAKMFDSWSKCYKNIDEGKHEMDTMIRKEFNEKIEKIINEDFKKVHASRKKVEESRLKFDTVRYEIKLKEREEAKKSAQNSGEPANGDLKESNEGDSETVEDSKDDQATKQEEKTTEPSEDDKLLEQLEDEFVSNTTAAVEIMGEITECSEILGLAKLFQNFQLVYFRQCVQEIEASLKTFDELEGEEN